MVTAETVRQTETQVKGQMIYEQVQANLQEDVSEAGRPDDFRRGGLAVYGLHIGFGQARDYSSE